MKSLYKTSNGNLSYCGCHDRYQIEFGNLLFVVKYSELLLLRNEIQSAKFQKDNQNPGLRNIIVCFGGQGVYLHLCQKEYKELKDLFNFVNVLEIIPGKRLSDHSHQLN